MISAVPAGANSNFGACAATGIANSTLINPVASIALPMARPFLYFPGGKSHSSKKISAVCNFS